MKTDGNLKLRVFNVKFLNFWKKNYYVLQSSILLGFHLPNINHCFMNFLKKLGYVDDRKW